jgi:DNA-binding MarR family transcriptional regulator
MAKKKVLSVTETQVIEVLHLHGAMTPSEIAVQTLMLPQEMLGVLEQLVESGYVVMREFSSSPDGRFAVLSNSARRALEEEL